MKRKMIVIPALAIMSTLAIGGLSACSSQDITAPIENEEVEITQNNTTQTPGGTTITLPEEVPASKPVAQKVSYISVNTEGVNIRSGAGTGYSSVGIAQKGTCILYTYYSADE